MINKGNVILDIELKQIEKFLNCLYNNNIKTTKIKKLDIVKIRITVGCENLARKIEIVEEYHGKYQIIKETGLKCFIDNSKKKITLFIGVAILFIIIYCLSNYIWSINIETGENIAPFEIRKELFLIGIKPGISKSKIQDADIEKKLENIDDRVLWIRVRTEGVSLKVKVLEKINPPTLEENVINDCVAKMDGEVKKIYVKSGTAMVKPGDMVKEGQVLIKAQDGSEGFEYETAAEGSIIANTFYEKSIETKIKGTEIKKTGNSNEDIYIKVFGIKIYLKKFKNNYENYDKIEENKFIINKVKYNELKEDVIDISKDEAISICTEKLKESLSKTLPSDAHITDYSSYTEDLEDGKISVKVMFKVEQEIVKLN